MFLFLFICFSGFLIYEELLNKGNVGAITIIVGSGQSYIKIQDAINASNPGDTIRIWAGIYYENLIINKTINLIGNGTTTTIINGMNKKDVINISANWVNITRLAISYSGNQTSGLNLDAGIEIYHSKYVHLYDINCSLNYYGIFLNYSDENFIEENTISWNEYGIGLFRSNFNTIKNNICNYNSENGIIVAWNSNSNIINNNTCDNNTDKGIDIIVSSSNSLINNSCNFNKGFGIYVDMSSSNNISNNICNNNKHYGIVLMVSQQNIIKLNNFSKNKNGIYLISNSNNNLLFKNIISYNTNKGLMIEFPANNNYFYHNNIISNNQQAIDNGNNYWSFEKEGNYWSDYIGLDNGIDDRIIGDGIGDTNIPHPSTGMDFYPFIKLSGWLYPGKPILFDPGEYDADGNYSIIWNGTGRTLSYVLEEDISSSFISPTEIYNGIEITFGIKNKPNGIYYYRVKAYNVNYVSEWSNIVDIIVNSPPTAPTNLIAKNPTGHEVTLIWDHNLDPDLKGYHILINKTDANESGPFYLVNTVTKTTSQYQITNLMEETTYYFAIMAFDIYLINSSISNIASITTLDVTVPKAPTGLIATVISDIEISLKWNANQEQDLIGYIIYINDSNIWGQNGVRFLEFRQPTFQ